jgi:aminopeptidase-like protein
MAAEIMFTDVDAAALGREMKDLMVELYPICRSITGDGVRQTLGIIRRQIPLAVSEVPSGKAVFDWEVPKEWNIRDAWIKNDRGEKIVDFSSHNLHVVNYSTPVRQRMTLTELKPHLFSLPAQPDLIPYRTSYYKETWGFCLPHNQLAQLPDGNYEVCIESTLAPGHLTLGEYFLPGKIEDEFLVSCHVCHPSLANDNLSGIALAVALAKRLGAVSRRRWSYRFLFIPGTIGSITWLALNETNTRRIKAGLVLTCVGDPGGASYKKSRRGDALIDRAVLHVLKTSGDVHRVIEFYPYGYDERQYCSPGFDLPVGAFMRSQHGTFPEYHTSADNLDFVRAESLADSFMKVAAVINILENNDRFLNLNPKCEPRLGKRGLYGNIGGARQEAFDELALLWVLNLSDGHWDLLSIAERAGIRFAKIQAAAIALEGAGLLRRAEAPTDGGDK